MAEERWDVERVQHLYTTLRFEKIKSDKRDFRDFYHPLSQYDKLTHDIRIIAEVDKDPLIMIRMNNGRYVAVHLCPHHLAEAAEENGFLKPITVAGHNFFDTPQPTAVRNVITNQQGALSTHGAISL